MHICLYVTLYHGERKRERERECCRIKLLQYSSFLLYSFSSPLISEGLFLGHQLLQYLKFIQKLNKANRVTVHKLHMILSSYWPQDNVFTEQCSRLSVNHALFYTQQNWLPNKIIPTENVLSFFLCFPLWRFKEKNSH